MGAYGHFAVSDDPDDTIAVGLTVATTTQNRPRVASALSPDGTGLHVQGVGVIVRVTSREELPAPFDQNPNLDPETQELWVLFREPDRDHRYSGRAVMTGDELRSLVSQAISLRDAQDGKPGH
jgi:hypothetical protein